jgi:hypothetical protein
MFLIAKFAKRNAYSMYNECLLKINNFLILKVFKSIYSMQMIIVHVYAERILMMITCCTSQVPCFTRNEI